jgi:nitrogen fixation protein FixH
VATEPDYYAKAINYEQTIVQRQTNAKLGWSASPSLDGDAATGAISLAVTLLDKAGEPVKGATVSAVAFASARSGQRQMLTLAAIDAATGKYSSPIKINRSGVWVVRITATRGDETFTRETELFVPGDAK